MNKIYLLGVVSVFFVACSKKEAPKEKPLTPVNVAQVLESTIPIYIEAIGHVVAYNQAEIKSRIEGELMGVHYQQGDIVQEGELLITIDPKPYIAKVEETQGQLLEDEASLKFAKEKAARYSTLVGSNYVSKLDYDQYVTNVEMFEGAVMRDEGALAEAQVNLSYCYITAPFTGRVGKKLIDKGNLVGNDGSTLVVLNQTMPIYVDFSIPEKDLTHVARLAKKQTLVVEAYIPQSGLAPIKGRLLLLDNIINTKTGMIPIRAVFQNEEGYLWTGQFVRIHLILKEESNALLIPETGVNLGQKGSYAVVVNDQHVAEIRLIVTGEKIGQVVQVVKGLKLGEYVVTNGQLNVGNGTKVDVKKVDKDYLGTMKEGEDQ